MMLRVLIALGGLAFASPAAAEECVAIANDLDRLACYDQENSRIVVESNKPAGSWQARTEISEFEDTTDVYLQTSSLEPVTCQMYGRPAPVKLMVRCLENTTSVFIATNCHLASGVGGYGEVDIRADDAKSITVRMNESTDNKALGLWNGGAAIPFIKSHMLRKDTLLMRFTPYSQSPVTARFEISGLVDAIRPLREACNW